MDLEAEFIQAHPHVQALALYLDWWFVRSFGHDGMVTDVSRTQEEYNRIYGGHPYTGPMPHLAPMSHAVDWRSSEFTLDEIQKSCDHMNAMWPRSDGKSTLMAHS